MFWHFSKVYSEGTETPLEWWARVVVVLLPKGESSHLLGSCIERHSCGVLADSKFEAEVLVAGGLFDIILSVNAGEDGATLRSFGLQMPWALKRAKTHKDTPVQTACQEKHVCPQI